MKSTKVAPKTGPDLSPEAKIRQIIALSLCVERVNDSDDLENWSSLDVMESIVVCERTLGLPELNEDELLDCKTIGNLVKMVSCAGVL